MLRLTHSHRNGVTHIKLEGKLVGPWVEECRELCAREIASGQALALDLSEVRFAEEEGIRLLRHMTEAGHVERSSGFVKELMRRDGDDVS